MVLFDLKATLIFQGAKSHIPSFDNGTPQGSTLSPNLFNYFVNQLHSIVLPRGVKMLTYADDIVIYMTGHKLQKALDLVVSMISCIGLKLQKALDLVVSIISCIGLKVSEMRLEVDNDGLAFQSHHSYLSSMYPCSIIRDGHAHKSAEHVFWYDIAKLAGNKHAMEQVPAAKNYIWTTT